MAFYYNMFGQEMGAIVIYLRIIPGLTEKIIWVKSGNKGLSWKREELTIGERNEYKVRIFLCSFMTVYNVEIRYLQYDWPMNGK